MVGIAFRDDGRGLDIPKIRARAEASNLLPVGATPDPAEVARCIFEPGFSTAAEVDAHSGRGMGMDIIKSKVIDEMGGMIEVRSAPGSYCEFQIYLPETVEPATANR
jgi:chemotaxis protein histidine kinase CheA